MKKLLREFLTLSTLAHGVLIAVLLFGTAFLAKPKPPEETEPVTILDFVPDELVDENVAQPAGAPPQQPAKVPVQPKPTPPPPPKPARKPEPRKPAPPKAAPKPAPKPPEKKAPAKPKEKKWKPSSKIKVNLKKTVRLTDTEAARRAERARQQREAARRRELASSLSRLRRQLTSQIRFSVPGVGGKSYANYGAYVRTIYDRAWHEPVSTTSARPVVRARVVIARDGRVLSAKILQGSGDPGLDRTVRDALNRVKNIGRPFPKSTRDRQRTFILNFNLEAKHGLG